MTTFFVIYYLYNHFRKLSHFKILKATVRNWRRDLHGNLVSYSIQIETRKTSDEMVFEELWIDEHKYSVRLSRSNRVISSRFSKNEILNLEAIPLPVQDIDGFNKGSSKKGKATIHYRVGNKPMVQSVSKFQEAKNGFRLPG